MSITGRAEAAAPYQRNPGPLHLDRPVGLVHIQGLELAQKLRRVGPGLNLHLAHQAFYKLLYTPHFSPDQLRAPSPARIAKALEQLDKDPNCQINVQCLEEDRYRILWVSPIYADDYVKELDYGYARGYVQYFMEAGPD